MILSADIIAVAANPQPVQLTGGQMITPEPDILALIKRLASVIFISSPNSIIERPVGFEGCYTIGRVTPAKAARWYGFWRPRSWHIYKRVHAGEPRKKW